MVFLEPGTPGKDWALTDEISLAQGLPSGGSSCGYPSWLALIYCPGTLGNFGLGPSGGWEPTVYAGSGGRVWPIEQFPGFESQGGHLLVTQAGCVRVEQVEGEQKGPVKAGRFCHQRPCESPEVPSPSCHFRCAG